MDRLRHGQEAGVRLVAVSKRFRGRQALDGVSLDVTPGEIVALVGPNGSGKTTLYNILTALEYPDAGKVFFDGFDISGLPGFGRARLGLSYLPQEPSVLRGLTVRDNLAFVLETREKDPARRARKVDALLDSFALRDLADSMPAKLSGGQQRRCEMARTLASDPRYLLLDEPFSRLDPLRIAALSAELRGLASKGLGILITDHNIRAVFQIADRVFVLANGVMIGTGSPSAVLADAGLRSAILTPDFVL